MNADGHAFAYGYDGVGRMTSLTNDNSETTRYGYQANGWLQTKTLANGVVTTYTRDQQGRLTDLANKNSGGTTLSDFSVPATGGYDGVGNRLSVTASMPGAPSNYSGTTRYAYDYGQSANPTLNRSQLTGEASTRASGTFAYGYDGGTSGGPGNPTSFKNSTNTFNADNQHIMTGLAYDGNGNPTTFYGSSLHYDPENRMTANTGGSQTEAYDSDGLRTWKQSAGGKRYFLYDGTQPVEEVSSSGALIATTTFGANGLVSRRNSNGSTFYAFDERGNVSQRLSSSGAVTVSELYDGYGTRTGTAAQPEPFGFEGQAGYYTDTETGLILCTHRFYSPLDGRWLTRDPMGYAGGVNLYGYVGNDPGNRWDPLGLWSITITAGVFGIAGLVGGGADAGIVFGNSGFGVTGDAYGGPGVGEGLDGSINVGFSPDPLPLGPSGDTMTGVAGGGVAGVGVVGSAFHPTHGTGIVGGGRGGIGGGEVAGAIAATGVTGSAVTPWWHPYNGVDHGGGLGCDQDNNPGNGGQGMPVNGGY